MDNDPVVGSLELPVELVDNVVDTLEGDRSGNNSRNFKTASPDSLHLGLGV